jgi:molecular chaperone DnaK
VADEPSIGIDLGTTNSCLATFQDGAVRIIERATGQRLLPSMVGIGPSGERVVGEEARLLSETVPENVAFATKRFIGQRWTAELAARSRTMFPFGIVSGPQEDVRIRIGGQVLPVVQIAAAILSELKADAEAHFEREVRRAVLTVPAAFNDAQRQATQEAASLAGLEVLSLVNEPTAAAMAFGLATGFNGHAAVFDLGGGTFDVSVLDVRDGVFEVIATGGDPFLGGEDFDAVLVQWLMSHLTEPGVRERVMKDPQALQRLKVAAEDAKKAVSVMDRVRISAVLAADRPGHNIAIETMLTRDFFERLVRPKTELCLSIVEKTMAEANVKAADIGAVLLVGGMTRVPLLRQMVIQRVGRLPPVSVNPDEAVAIGAAIHAAELTKKAGQSLLLDVVGSTLGVGIVGGMVKPLIKKNASLPCVVTEVFHPGREGQTAARIPVVQGEGKYINEAALLGELKLTTEQGLSRTSAIEVRFEIGVDGTLSVTARDRATGLNESAKIARANLREDERARLQKTEEALRAKGEPVDPTERAKNRHARRALHEVLVPLRRLHRDLKLAANEAEDADGRDMVEQLGRRIVDAEKMEHSGTRDDVVALAKSTRELVLSLVKESGPPPPPPRPSAPAAVLAEEPPIEAELEAPERTLIAAAPEPPRPSAPVQLLVEAPPDEVEIELPPQERTVVAKMPLPPEAVPPADMGDWAVPDRAAGAPAASKGKTLQWTSLGELQSGGEEPPAEAQGERTMVSRMPVPPEARRESPSLERTDDGTFQPVEQTVIRPMPAAPDAPALELGEDGKFRPAQRPAEAPAAAAPDGNAKPGGSS